MSPIDISPQLSITSDLFVLYLILNTFEMLKNNIGVEMAYTTCECFVS